MATRVPSAAAPAPATAYAGHTRQSTDASVAYRPPTGRTAAYSRKNMPMRERMPARAWCTAASAATARAIAVSPESRRWGLPSQAPHRFRSSRQLRGRPKQRLADVEAQASGAATRRQGVDFRSMQKLLGHASSKTTEIYTHEAAHRLSAIPRPNRRIARRGTKGEHLVRTMLNAASRANLFYALDARMWIACKNLSCSKELNKSAKRWRFSP
jgi:integrase